MGSRGPLPRAAISQPPPPSEPLEPPAWLPPQATRVWLEVEPSLRQAGRLRPEHVDALSQYCCTAAELRALAVTIANEGVVTPDGSPAGAAKHAARLRLVLLTLGKALGCDPSSATRLDQMPSPHAEEDDPLAAFARKRSDRAG